MKFCGDLFAWFDGPVYKSLKNINFTYYKIVQVYLHIEQFDIVVAQGKEEYVGSAALSAEDLQAKGAEMKAEQKKEIIHLLKHF
ncbi:hypothetical protein [Bacillus thuringiensis]|uniref:hypothetical protein n=1 Tax=Bacillus thuringiensis TaxID=1428 RepID=UPI0026910530